MTDLKDKLARGGAGYLLGGPVGAVVALLASDAVDKLGQAKNGTEAMAVRDQAQIRAEVVQTMARAQQEVAIAARIATANEVEIEEFYEGTGEGSLGAKTDGETVVLGAAGSGRKITRRVFRLKGLHDGYREVMEQAFGGAKDET